MMSKHLTSQNNFDSVKRAVQIHKDFTQYVDKLAVCFQPS